MENKTDIISNIKRRLVNKSLNVEFLILDTCNEIENLCINDIILDNGILYSNSNFGYINLEETINDMDDWYTLEDVVLDMTANDIIQENIFNLSYLSGNDSLTEYYNNENHNLYIDICQWAEEFEEKHKNDFITNGFDYLTTIKDFYEEKKAQILKQ